MHSLFIGLMSGTSLDGVDGVLADFSAAGELPPRVLGHVHQAFAPQLAQELLVLNAPGANELHRAALAGNALVRVYAQVVEDLLLAGRTSREQVVAIGAHGQTVRHRPGEFDTVGYTLQLNNPALLAELTGIDVVADLRARDLAAGGQGAPLVPAFHRSVFARSDATVAVLNIGGMSNLTVLAADGATLGFDCGPGNVLLDHWCRVHTGKAFDEAGAWAATGGVIQPLLQALRAEPYFALPPPKTTGRDLFGPSWLAAHLDTLAPGPDAAPEDVQATLAELTAAVCATDVLEHARGAAQLLVCGGGAYNDHLMRRLAAWLPDTEIESTDTHGLPAAQVEACAFAWLARCFVMRQPGSLASVTGARGPRILGALYPVR